MPEIYPGLETLDKQHDESRQGEALSVSQTTEKKCSYKKIYISKAMAAP